MTASAPQPALFPDAISASPRLPVPVSRRFGRGATPKTRFVAEFPAPNPAGLRRLTFAYRRLKRWQEAHLLAAHDLVKHYFAVLGGFRLADDAIVRPWHDVLAGGLFTADELRWAIDAKAASLQGETPEERRDLRKYLTTPDGFLARAGYWLEQSPQYQTRVSEERRREMARKLDEARAAAVAAETGQPGPAAADREKARAARRAADEARRLAYWNGLSDAQKTAARKAVEGRFKEYIAVRCGENPQDPKFDDLFRGWCINWAILKWPPVGTGTVSSAKGLPVPTAGD